MAIIGSRRPNTPNDFTATGDHVGAVDYIVTGHTDTFNPQNDSVVRSIRDAIFAANGDSDADEIWLPAWKIKLGLHRGTNSTDMSVTFGDLDILNSLTLRGVDGVTKIGWLPGKAVDRVFELLGDYNNDGTATGQVGAEDYTVWADTQNSTTDLRADGNDDGVVNSLDYAIWVSQFNKTFTKLGVEVLPQV